jgi:GTP-binding protein
MFRCATTNVIRAQQLYRTSHSRHSSKLVYSKVDAYRANFIKPSPEHLTVSLVGRPNTGKSTLFNRLTKTKMAIVSSIPGTTRDRREGKGFLAGLPLNVIDTGGLDNRGVVSKFIQQQVEKSFADSDVILLLVDGRAGLTSLDEHFAKWLRKTVQPKKPSATAAPALTDGNVPAVTATTLSEDSGVNAAAGVSLERKRSIIVVANKTEGGLLSNAVMSTVADASRLGFGDPVLVSATHGDGMADLAQVLLMEARRRGKLEEEVSSAPHQLAVVKKKTRMLIKEMKDMTTSLVAADQVVRGPITVEDRVIQLAIMGRPNVGKSTLLNAFIREDRAITGPMPGLTRDAVHAEWQHRERLFRLVDTAGLTRIRTNKSRLETMQDKEKRLSTIMDRASSSSSPENDKSIKALVKLPGLAFVDPESDPSQYSYQISEFALISALNALRYAQVVLLVVEGSQGKFSKLDLQLAGKCLEEGRGLVIAANKSDLMVPSGVSSAAYEEGVRSHIAEFLREFGDIPVVVSSGTEGKGIDRILNTVIKVHDAWSRRVSTGDLNSWLKDLLVTNPPPRVNGRLLNLKYITQIKSRPPTFALFTNMEELPGFFERFLKSNIQQAFKLQGVPLRFVVRKTSPLLNRRRAAVGDGKTAESKFRAMTRRSALASPRGKKGIVGPNRDRKRQQRKVTRILASKNYRNKKSHRRVAASTRGSSTAPPPPRGGRHPPPRVKSDQQLKSLKRKVARSVRR